jgi:hypothetical protein
MSRPRGLFARALLEKVDTDTYLENYDTKKVKTSSKKMLHTHFFFSSFHVPFSVVRSVKGNPRKVPLQIRPIRGARFNNTGLAGENQENLQLLLAANLAHHLSPIPRFLLDPNRHQRDLAPRIHVHPVREPVQPTFAGRWFQSQKFQEQHHDRYARHWRRRWGGDGAIGAVHYADGSEYFAQGVHDGDQLDHEGPIAGEKLHVGGFFVRRLTPVLV